MISLLHYDDISDIPVKMLKVAQVISFYLTLWRKVLVFHPNSLKLPKSHWTQMQRGLHTKPSLSMPYLNEFGSVNKLGWRTMTPSVGPRMHILPATLFKHKQATIASGWPPTSHCRSQVSKNIPVVAKSDTPRIPARHSSWPAVSACLELVCQKTLQLCVWEIDPIQTISIIAVACIQASYLLIQEWRKNVNTMSSPMLALMCCFSQTWECNVMI